MNDKSMKKALINLFVSIIFVNYPVLANQVSEVNLDLAPTHELVIKDPVVKDSKSLIIDKNETIEEIVQTQRSKDMEDLEILWNATVEKSHLIKFAISKLSTPESERRIHSSFMAKSLSALISGATFVPCFMGANYSLQTASFAAGKLANNYINKNNVPKTMPLTDTEVIELAGMIENLQDSIISSYYNYKGALNELRQIRTKIVLYNKNYANAIQNNNKLEQIVSGALYEDMLIEENYAKSNAQKYQLELERLTSKETIAKLHLYQKDINDELFATDLLQSHNTKEIIQNEK